MKKRTSFLVLFLSILTVVLVACGGTKDLKAADFDNVKMGMKVSELEKKLGKPTKEVTDEKEAEKEATKDMQNLATVMTSNAEQITKFAGNSAADMQKLAKEFSDPKNLKIFQYKYDKDKTKNIYVIDDKVIWMTFD